MLSFSSMSNRPAVRAVKLKSDEKPKNRNASYGNSESDRIVNVKDPELKWMGTGVVQMHTSDCEIMERDDALANCTCNGHREEFENIALNSGLYSIINRLIDKDNLNQTDGFVSYLEIGMSDTAANPTQTGTILPKARKKIVQAYRDTTNAVFKTFFNGTQAVSNQTSVAIGSSGTQFSVLAGTGANFAVGQLIQVGLSTPEFTEIQTIVGDTFTVSPALTSIPSGGQYVKQAYKELVLYGTSSANDNIGSGVAFARTTSFTARTKDQNYGMTIEWHITLT